MTSTDVVVRDKNEPAPKKRHHRAKHDWEQIKTAYIEGFPKDGDQEERQWVTLAEVARRFNLNEAMVRRKSADGRWPEQRAAYQARMAQRRKQRRILSLSKEAVDLDGKALSAAKLGITMVTTRLGEIARDAQLQNLRRQEADRRVAAGLVVDPSDYDTVIDARELNVLAQAGSGFQALARAALGEDVIRHEHTGVDGGAIEMDVEHTVTASSEMRRDDPRRFDGVLDALHRAGAIQDITVIEEDDNDEDDDE